jgi:hypothetical protein
MDLLWVHDDTVMEKEPLAKTTTLGWEATRKNFEVLFRTPETQDHSVWDCAFECRATWAMGAVTRTATQDGPAFEV